MRSFSFILASASQARKRILENIGLKIKLEPTHIAESRKLSQGAPALVKANALKKARFAASKVRNGIIIGADSICVFKGRPFGKARNFAEGVKMLKTLSGTQHYVYSGLAVIKKSAGRQVIIVDYAKTKVWLQQLSDAEIKRYLRKSRSFDKAGSFDIQGLGGLFIERIEGCFYNVAGLPIAKLFTIFKRLHISILCLTLVSLAALSGCATEYNIATQEEDIIFYNTDREVAIGRNASNQIEHQFKLIGDPLLASRVTSIGERIVNVCDRKDIIYHFALLDDKAVNAVSLPGGFIYVNRGLIDFIKSDDELAGVLAHEVAHVVAKHSIKRLQAAMGYNILRILAMTTGSSNAVGGMDLAAVSMLTAYSREDEILADKLGARYMRQAGFSPAAFVSFLERLHEKKWSEPLRPAGFYARTHPYISERIGIIKQETGQEMDFKDYINRTESSR
jgi:MAF protein